MTWRPEGELDTVKVIQREELLTMSLTIIEALLEQDKTLSEAVNATLEELPKLMAYIDKIAPLE
jgi:hypothetical protein